MEPFRETSIASFDKKDWEAIDELLRQGTDSQPPVQERLEDRPDSHTVETGFIPQETLNGLLETLKTGANINGTLEIVQSALRQAESRCVEEYVREGSKVTNLRDQILQCDAELNEMERQISHWSARLSRLSKSTREYYEEAALLNKRLLQQKQSHGTILQFLENATLSSELVSGIIESHPSSKQFVQHLVELEEKVQFLSKPEVRESAAMKDIQPFTRKIIFRASEKVRDHLQSKIQLLQNPNTNVQIIQQNVLLKQKEYFRFLHHCAFKVYKEIQNSYISIISQVYQGLFKKYVEGLVNLKEEVNLKGETLVESSGFQLKSSSTSSTSFFVLGKRIESLRCWEEPALVLAIAREHHQRLFIEEIFRCVTKLLVDTCTSEYLFVLEIFATECNSMLTQILSEVVSLCFHIFEKHLSSTFDIFGCLLVMKENEKFRDRMASRQIPFLDDYFVKIDILVKPRFQELMQQNIQSIAQASSKLLFPGQENISPLALTRRFVEYVSGLIQVAVEMNDKDKMLEESIKRLGVEYLSLLNRIGNYYTRKKSRSLFIVNNLDLICLVLEEQKLDQTEEYSFYESILSKQVTTIVDLELEEHFADFMSLFNRYSKDHSVIANSNESSLRKIFQEFSSNWKKSLEHIRDNTLDNFPNFERGKEVRKKTMTRLLACYREIYQAMEEQHIISSHTSTFPSVNSLIQEIRKYVEESI